MQGEDIFIILKFKKKIILSILKISLSQIEFIFFKCNKNLINLTRI